MWTKMLNLSKTRLIKEILTLSIFLLVSKEKVTSKQNFTNTEYWIHQLKPWLSLIVKLLTVSNNFAKNKKMYYQRSKL